MGSPWLQRLPRSPVSRQNDCRAPASSEALPSPLGSPPPPKIPRRYIETGWLLLKRLGLILDPSSSSPQQCRHGVVSNSSPFAVLRCRPPWVTRLAVPRPAVRRSHLKRSGAGGWMTSTMSDRCLHNFIGDSPLTNCERGPHCTLPRCGTVSNLKFCAAFYLPPATKRCHTSG